jgi:hypothetical protein
LRGRWTVPTWLVNLLLELAGAVALYFVLWLPLSAQFYAAVPQLADVPLFGRGPEIILIISIIGTLIGGVTKLVKMLTNRHDVPASYNVKAS